MSYDINLIDPVSRATIEFDCPHEMRGGIYQIGGSTEAWLNVTYNYAPHYYRVLPNGIRSIYGLTGAESIPVLEAAIAMLGDDITTDYWQPTEGNAKKPLLQLLAFAKRRPDGIWEGD